MPYIIFAIVFVLIIKFFEEASTLTITFVVVGLIVALIAFLANMSNTKEKTKEAGKKKREERLEKEKVNTEKQRQYIRDKATEYKAALAKKRTQLITKDDYGDADESKWKKEIASFFNSKIESLPESMALPISPDGVISGEEIGNIIDDVAREGQRELGQLYSFSDDMDGIEYEHFCAEILRESGWEAKVSQASNDQGADIIAERDGKKVAIQCKKYSSPVGNKAVQEVSASKLHYGTEFAAVVTNNTFTNSAKQLANSNNVHLLHHSDLESFYNYLHEQLVNA